MNKKVVKKIISFIFFSIMMFLFIVLGTKDYSVKVENNIRFSNEYQDISKNNIFFYAKNHEILDILNGKSGIIFMGFSSNIWSHYYAGFLNEVAITKGIDKIYYYDFKADREINNSVYLNIVKKLNNYLIATDTGDLDISAPTILIVNNGNIIFYDNDVSTIKNNISPDDYFSDYRKNLFEEEIASAIDLYLGVVS